MTGDKVHYLRYDADIRATYVLLDYVVETVNVWHDMPDYRKEGRLLYLSQLESYLASLRAARKFERLTKSQLRELRNLERLAEQARGTIKALKDDYAASKRRQANNESESDQ